jgi:D-glycero-alpha-D-manno-heptose-7-phosphate kinase
MAEALSPRSAAARGDLYPRGDVLAPAAHCTGSYGDARADFEHGRGRMMVAVRTPLRVSLFGGGTDYPAYFHREPGAVLGFAIDKYIYLSAQPLTSSVGCRYRLSNSHIETSDSVAAIRHPAIRAALQHYGFDEPTDFSVEADLPASLGLGSSSAFAVGVINLVSHLMGAPRTRMELAREAIHLEQELLRENVGVQDQLHVSFGGVNRFDLYRDRFRIAPVGVSGHDLRVLTDWMVLVNTGVRRHASTILAEQVKKTAQGSLDAELREMLGLVDAAQQVLEDARRRDDAPARLGGLLHQSWQLKKRLSSEITAPGIDDLYEFCLASGAIGGKLCGAGGGGFLLMVVPPERRGGFEQVIGQRRCVRFRIDSEGTVLLPAVAPALRALA